MLRNVLASRAALIVITLVTFTLGPRSGGLIAVPAEGYASGTDWVAQLTGAWESEDKVDGQPRVTVDLAMQDGKPSGTVVIRGIQADNNADSLTLPIRDGKVQVGSVWFETDPGQDGVTEWSLGMVSTEKALLSAVRDNFEIPKYVMERPAGHH